jgi:hypothetical protein
MTTFRSEETLVGLVALALVPWIAWTVVRGLREEKLPIGRTYVTRDRPAAFAVLIGFYVVAAVLAAGIAADFLFNLKLLELA